MTRTLGLPALLLALPLLTGSLVACSGGSGGNSFGTAIAASLKDSTRADLSGQDSVFTGTLGSGTSFTFPAVKGQSYFIHLETTDADDQVVFEFGGENGEGLKSKTLDHGETYQYDHTAKSMHVIVIMRPRNPFDTDIGISKVTVVGTGNFADDKVHVNFIVAGKHTGLGVNGDLVTTGDRAAFTDALMQKVQTHFAQTGISISYEGFSYTADQVKSANASLIGPDDQATCAAGESAGGSGFEVVERAGLDAWGELGFAETDPNFDRGHGINVFLIHHFTNDGTVGLSPRPGYLVGKGADTALCVASFLQQGSTLIPRTVDDMALVTAHEIGHFLGLLHTTTFTPDPLNPTEAIDDGVKDTPKCDVTQDFNGDGRVGVGDGCPDETNIMFYQSNTGTQNIFTPDQSAIMRQLLSLQEH
tara:strand:- start:113 stop:1366 length:1254 start_codon:yes stop_codon:yes gene_type:complete